MTRRLSPDNRAFRAAMQQLREVTAAPTGASVTTKLIRAAAVEPEICGAVLLRGPLQTRADRQRAVIACAIALAQAADEREGHAA